MSKLIKLANKFADKLLKVANFPDEASVLKVIESVYGSVKSNPALKGTRGIVPNISVSGSIGEKVYVYFQVIADPKWYSHLIEEPQKSGIVSLLKVPVEQALQSAFKMYDFQVKVGIVI